LKVDVEGFHAAMAEQKARSQAAGKFGRGAGDKLVLEAEATAWLASRGIRPTDDAAKYTALSDAAPLDATILAVFSGGAFLEGGAGTQLPATGTIGIVLDRTSFYAESGGQAADTGALVAVDGSGGAVDVIDTQVFGGYVLHIGSVRAPEDDATAVSPLSIGQRVNPVIDAARRALIAPNHTMTHVLNFALRGESRCCTA
jgi:alanyl-tRNA synthetase